MDEECKMRLNDFLLTGVVATVSFLFSLVIGVLFSSSVVEIFRSFGWSESWRWSGSILVARGLVCVIAGLGMEICLRW